MGKPVDAKRGSKDTTGKVKFSVVMVERVACDSCNLH